MTLEEALLQKLAEWRFDDGRQTLAIPHAESGTTAAVQAECSDRVGCQVWEVNLTRTEAATPSADLRTRAQRIADRATGLREPLRLIEADGHDAALLRSAAPQKRGDDVFYYEVELRTGGAGVRRYQASTTGGTRRQIAFPLTHEALAKLAGDLTDA
jgi:hypothetical protein